MKWSFYIFELQKQYPLIVVNTKMPKIYHYTKLSTAIEFILPSMTLRTNFLNKMNGPKENQNWTVIIGKIKETIIVLVALGSFIGGISPLFQAREKLEESTTVIEKTSINVNNIIMTETFNIHSSEQFKKFDLINQKKTETKEIGNK